MKKKILACLLMAVLMVTGGMCYMDSNVAFADTLDEQQAEVEEQQAEVSNELADVEAKVEEKQAEVAELEASIDVKAAEITAAANEIEDLKVDMQEREEGLNERLRAMYKNGSVGYLDVLLGSNSISEFLNNIEMIQRIFKNDQDTLKTLEEQHGILQEKQAVLETEKAALDQQKEKQAAKQAELEESKAELQAQLDALNAEADRISAEIQARQEALAQQQAQSGTSRPNYSGGRMMWPCDSTYITSEFGYRIHPITGIWTGHTGIDIGCSMYAPVYAAESGTVILSEWYGGYGYAVVIDHGGGITTLYGHNEELYVSVGQQVSRGETIAGAGSTGWSTGPHVHFEVREGGEYVDPMGYL